MRGLRYIQYACACMPARDMSIPLSHVVFLSAADLQPMPGQQKAPAEIPARTYENHVILGML